MSDRPQDDDETRARLEKAYDRFAERVLQTLEAGREHGREALETAMETVRAKLAAAGEFSAAQGEQFKRHLRRDLEQSQDYARRIAGEAREHLHPARIRDGTLAGLAALLQAGGETMRAWSDKAGEAVLYETGEITSAGTLTCLNCGHVLHLDRTAHVPPCPACLGSRFRKSY